MSSLTFECGEFKPGKTPIIIPPIRKPGGGSKIPIVTQKTDKSRPPRRPGIPIVPGTPTQPVPAPRPLPDLYKCVEERTLRCPPWLKEIQIGIIRRCRKCSQAETVKQLRTGKGPCMSKKDCEATCKSQELKCAPKGPITLPHVPGVTLPPITSGEPGTQTLPGVTAPPAVVGEPGNRGPTQVTADPVEVTKTQGGVTPTRAPSIGPNGEIVIRRTEVEPLSPEKLTLEVEELATGASLSVSSGIGIYHNDYTLFGGPEQLSSTLVPNDEFLDIFSKDVPAEVAYMLNNGQSKEWKELPYNSLSLNHIWLAVQPRLLQAFASIKDLAGVRVPMDDFLETIRRLLVSGRLTEFNPQYYYNLAAQQAHIPEVEVVPGFPESMERFGLSIVTETAVSVDYQRQKERSFQNMKRYRPLHTDIETAIPAEVICEGALSGTSAVFSNAGLNADTYCINIDDATVETVSSYLDIGDGAGHYVRTSGINCDKELPFSMWTQLSSSYFSPPGSRAFAVEQLGGNPNMRLTASAVTGQSEFDVSAFWTTFYQGTVGYFILELSSVTELDNNQKIIDTVKARYVRETDANVINEHAKNYGFAVDRVNIDYRDPFHQYAMDSGNIDLIQDDIGYQNFKDRRRAFSEKAILVRNIPAAIVLVPGQGSHHNPFAGGSIVETFTPIVSRTLTLMDRLGSPEDFETPPLSPSFVESFYVGLVEEENIDTQTAVWRFNGEGNNYTSAYYFNGAVSSEGNLIQLNPAAELVRIFEEVLKTKYSISKYGITWWDLFRRISLNTYAGLDYEVSPGFYAALRNGWLGHKVREVLNRPEETGTGLLDDLNPLIEDIIYLTMQGRRDAWRY